MSTMNYSYDTDLYSVSAWYGADYFEMTSKLFPSHSRTDGLGTVHFDRAELKELAKFIDKVLKDTEDIGYLEQRNA